MREYDGNQRATWKGLRAIWQPDGSHREQAMTQIMVHDREAGRCYPLDDCTAESIHPDILRQLKDITYRGQSVGRLIGAPLVRSLGPDLYGKGPVT